MEILVGLVILVILIAILRAHYKTILGIALFIIPMVIALPSLLIALFKVNALVGLCALAAAVIGWAAYAKTTKMYPFLEEGHNAVLGWSCIIITIAAAIVAMIWGFDEPAQGSYIGAAALALVYYLYGGLALSLIIGTLTFIPYRIALRSYRIDVTKKLGATPLDLPVPLKSVITKLHVEKPVKFVAMLHCIAYTTGQYRISPPACGEVQVVSIAGYNAMVDITTEYLLRNGARLQDELATEMMQNSTKAFYLGDILKELVNGEIIDKKEIGQPLEAGNMPKPSVMTSMKRALSLDQNAAKPEPAPPRYLYSHKSAPMKSTIIDEDFD